MFFGKLALKKISKLELSEENTVSKLVFSARFEEHQKLLISDLITNVKYRSIWVMLAGIESA
jgi:hypothetical protein